MSHRSAAAFVDAEARMFLQHRPIGPGDRVMAGLSVAFDASCEEMWLAWRYGACLVPAPRSLVRSGMDLGPWLRANDITVVSTVPTLVTLWPLAALDDVRLLILGGEACPPEIGARLATPDREVWNTYGPTEATVVACGARLDGEPPVRIGLPLDGWDLAVVDAHGNRVAQGEPGELIIGGVGLARYLDPEKDAVVYAPMPTLGWGRAYRSGDIVRFDGEGLVFHGRADDQVKVGGRRIELGEVDSALLGLPGVSGAAAAVRRSEAGNSLLVGYVTTEPGFDAKACVERLRSSMPAALVPRLAVVDTLPTRTSGKIDRDALPWPLPARPGSPASDQLTGLDATAAWVAGHWAAILGGAPSGPDDDFFDLGGGSLTAAQLVSPAARAVPRGDGRRRLRPPRPGRPRRGPRRHADAHRPAERRRAPGAGHHPGGPGAGLARLPRHRGPALAHLGRGGRARRPWAVRPRLAARRRVGLGAARLAAARAPRRARRARGRRGPRRCSPGCAPAPTAAVAPCTCGSGWPSASSTSSAPRACRRRPWSRSTPGCSGAGSAGTSTCTASPR